MIREHQNITNQNKKSSTNKSIVAKTIEYLEKLINTQPNTEVIELEFMQLGDIRPFIDILSSFDNLKRLSLHGNRIKEIPLEIMRLVSVEEIDLSNNMIKDAQQMILALTEMPNLKRLISSFRGADEQVIKQGIPNLEYYNNSKSIIQRQRKVVEVKRIIRHEINNQHLEKPARMFDQIRAIYRKSYAKNNDKANKIQFDQETQETMRSMQINTLQHKNSPENVLSAIYLTARYSLYKVVESKLINLVNDVEPQYGKLLQELFDDYTSIVTAMADVAMTKPVAAPSLNKNPKQNQIQAFQKQLKRVRREKEQLVNQVASLESQAKIYIDALVRASKGEKFNFSHNIFRGSSRNTQGSPVKQQSITDRQKTRTNQKDLGIELGNNKNLSLKQLKDVIMEIQDNKIRFDQKLFDGQQPRQTMYEYLFTFLNQKYGLKNLTIEWASSIVSGIQKYSGLDNDVAVFGKMLRNECQQQFRDVQSEAKATIQQCLKIYIKGQNKLKSEAQVKSILQNKIHGEISDEEAESIIKYLYPQHIAKQVIEKLQPQYINVEKTNKKQPREEGLNLSQKKNIKYSYFLKCILDSQLKSHQKYLKPLTQAFHSLDTDNDGILSQKQFSDLLHDMCSNPDKHLRQFLNMIDPYQKGVITYSQVVWLFSNYPEGNPILSHFAQSQMI